MKNKNGFTLVELVVAIAILGVITLMAIPTIKSVQKTNSKTKYEAYDKSLTAAGKAYADSYGEDLFGATNTGCAIIRYSDLKGKDLIENIQIKNTTCENSCIYVRKSKKGNYSYKTLTTCKEKVNGTTKTVYGSGEVCKESLCKIEDGIGPTYNLRDTSGYQTKPAYKRGQNPKILITIADKGIGLKENQKVTYQWYREGQKVTTSGGSGTIKFENKNYDRSATRQIPNLPGMSNVTDTTTYKLVVNGTIWDVDLNKTVINNATLTFKYFVARVKIRLNANGGRIKVDPRIEQERRERERLERKCRIDPWHPECKLDPSDPRCKVKEKETSQRCKTRPYLPECKYSDMECMMHPYRPDCEGNVRDPRCPDPTPQEPEQPKSPYSIDANGNILKSGTILVYNLKEYETLPEGGLVDWNNENELDMEKPGYSIKQGLEWNSSSNGTGKDFNQTTRYEALKFCDSPYADCNVTLYANWKIIYTYNVGFYHLGNNAIINPWSQTRSCFVFDRGASCTVDAPPINSLPAASGCGSAYSVLLSIHGWNTNPNAGTGVWGPISVNQSVNYYSIITANPYYMNDFNKFVVYAHTCGSGAARNVLERYNPSEGGHSSDNDKITCINEGYNVAWTGAWAVYGTPLPTDTDDGAWLYLHGIGNSCRYAYKKDGNGNHPSKPCEYAWIKAYQLLWY